MTSKQILDILAVGAGFLDELVDKSETTADDQALEFLNLVRDAAPVFVALRAGKITPAQAEAQIAKGAARLKSDRAKRDAELDEIDRG